MSHVQQGSYKPMQHYIASYILPVLVILAGILLWARSYNHGRHFKKVGFIALGFLLGWASAFLSLYFFHLYR